MSGFQTEMLTEPRSGAEDKKKGRYPNPIIDLENAFIEIDGVEHNVADLLKLVVQILKEKKK
jgi:hypothetical protein